MDKREQYNFQNTGFDNEHLVTPDGLSVRRFRRELGWSRKDLSRSISIASLRANGIEASLTPNQISGIEENSEPIKYSDLCLVASGLNCNPIELLL